MSTPVTYRDLLIDRYRLIYDWIPAGAERVLDVGCGNGLFTQWLGRKARFVAGTDHNAGQIRQAREGARGGVFVVAEGERLPFATGSFDAVVMSDVLEHMRDDREALREAWRVLTPGGRLLISLPNRGPLAWLDGDNLVNGLVWGISRLRLPRRGRTGGGKRFLYEGFVFRRHRHYGLRDLDRLLGGKGRIERRYYGGTFVWPLAYLIEKAIEVFGGKPLVATDYRLLRRLRGADFRIRLGHWSYNLVVAVAKPGGETP